MVDRDDHTLLIWDAKNATKKIKIKMSAALSTVDPISFRRISDGSN